MGLVRYVQRRIEARLKAAVAKAGGDAALTAVLGKVLSRKLVSKTYTESLPGAPDGKYVVVQYRTSFEHKESAVETVTPMLDEDGRWRVSAGVRAVDLAPTIAFMLGIPGPQNARGKILYSLLKNGGRYKEITVLDISDYHGQLVPLTEAADNVASTGASNPSFAIGGSAFLKPWFDWYRGEAPNGSLTVAGGD